MARIPELTPGMLFAWKVTRLPFAGKCIKSPCFSFLDAEWFLAMHSFNAEYSVSLQRVTEWVNFQPFEVTAGIEEDSKYSNALSSSIPCQRVKVSIGLKGILVIRGSELLKKRSAIGPIRFTSTFTVFCMLHSESRLEKEWITVDLEGLSLDLGNLLEEGTMPDVQIKCVDGIVPAHRSVLTARSEAFSALFRNDVTEGRSGVVNMPDMHSDVLGLLLKYVYTGKLPEASPDLLRRLYAAGNIYAIPGLKKGCSEWMRGDLTVENCLSYLLLAAAYCDATFKDMVVSFIVDNQGVVFKSGAWFQFQKQQPELTIEVFNGCSVKWQHGNASLGLK